MSYDNSRATPPHQQNQLQRCTRGIQTGVRNGKLYEATPVYVKRLNRKMLKLIRVLESYRNHHLTRYTTPAIAHATITKRETIMPATTSLNFR